MNARYAYRYVRPVAITALLLFYFIIHAYPQEMNGLDHAGRRHGKWVKNYPSGNIRFEGNFEHGIPTGIFRYYHENGKIRVIMKHTEGNSEASAEIFNEAGIRIAQGAYLNEQKSGEWVYYNEEDGKVLSVEHYRKGQPHGIWKVYYPSDTIVSDLTEYREGEKHGRWRQFFADGNPRTLAEYQNGKLHGNYMAYYANRQLLNTGQYHEGVKDGEWIYYRQDGAMKRKEWYQAGELVREEILLPDEPVEDTPLDPSLDPEKSEFFVPNK